MSNTRSEELIARLVGDLRPVRRLRPPVIRLGIWLLLSLPWVIAVVFVMGLRPDINARLSDGRWLVEQGAALTTAMMAAMAAFCAGVPGRPRWEHFLPLLPLTVWLGTLAQGSAQEWLSAGSLSLIFHQDWQCLPGIIFAGFGPAAVIVVMVRRGFPSAPMTTIALGALASGGLAEVGLRFFHPEAASLMVLVWQVGSVFGLALLASIFGRTLLPLHGLDSHCA
jgi:hypothetical protein